MTTVGCPKCHEQVSVPAGTRSQVQVRCPLCQEQYALVDALKGLPPLLIIVPEEGAAPASTSPLSVGDSAVFAPDVDEVHKTDYTAAESHEWVDEEPHESASEDDWRLADAPEVPPPQPTWPPPESTSERDRSALRGDARVSSMSMRRRPKKKQAGPIRSLIQIVGGGVLGLVLAQLILWWMPGNWALDKRDPAGIAKQVAEYAPFLVPDKVLNSRSSQPNTVASTQPKDQNPSTPNPSNEMTFGMKGAEENARSESSPASGESSDKSSEPTTSEPAAADKSEPVTDQQPPAPENRTTGEPEAATKVGDSERESAKSEESAPAVNTVNKSAETAHGLKNPPQISAQQLTSLLSDAQRAQQTWDKGAAVPREERLKQWKDLYTSFAKIGEAFVFMDRHDPAFVEAFPLIQQAIAEFAKDQGKLEYSGAYAAILLGQSQRDQNGFMLWGTVVSHDSSAERHTARIKLFARTETFVTLLRPASAEPLTSDSKVLVLGAIVSEPNKNIVGYEGEEPQVVLEGYSLLIP